MRCVWLIEITVLLFLRALFIDNLFHLFSSRSISALQEFILEDIRSRYDLLMSWMYREYDASEENAHGDETDTHESYDDCLLNLMDSLYGKLDPKDK